MHRVVVLYIVCVLFAVKWYILFACLKWGCECQGGQTTTCRLLYELVPPEKEKPSMSSAEWVRGATPLLSCSLEKPLYTCRLLANAARSCSRRAVSFSNTAIAWALQHARILG